MSDYEVQRERIVERPVTTERIIERDVPVDRRRVVVERGGGYGFNPFSLVIAAAVIILLLLLILGAFT